MRISISNLAWNISDDDAVAALLSNYKVDAIDVAPGKYFADFATTSKADIDVVKNWWRKKGISIVGMQALLFGTKGLNVFGTKESQEKMLDHLYHVCRIGAGLGATKLVFGSPKNRDRGKLYDDEANSIAIEFFRKLGDIAADEDVAICLEPNPTHYGANFMTTSVETAKVVQAVRHPNIEMQLDTGAMAINCEDGPATVQQCHQLVGHVHASEANLAPIGDAVDSFRQADHASIGEAIQRLLPDHIVTIEMLATVTEPPLQAIERALQVTTNNYRQPANIMATT